MAQQRNPDVYPSTTAGEGTNNKQLAATNPGTADDTSTCNFSTDATQRYILVKPLVGGTTTPTVTANPPGGQDFGWNVLKADMNRVPTTKSTIIPAGVWKFQCQFVGGGATAPTAAAFVNVHKRSSAGALTVLFSSESAAITPPTLSGPYRVNWSSASQAEVRLLVNETIHVEYWIRSAGIVLVGNTVAFRVGAGTGLDQPQVLVPTGFSDLTFTAPAAVSTAIGKIVRRISIKRTAVSTAVAKITRKLSTKKSAVAAAVPVMARRLSLKRTFAAVSPTVGVRRNQLNTKKSVVSTAVPVMSRRLSLKRTLAAISPGVPVMARRLSLKRTFAAVSPNTPAFVRKVIASRILTTTATWIGDVLIRLPTRKLPAGGGGAPRTLNFPMLVRLAGIVVPSAKLRYSRLSRAAAVRSYVEVTCSLRVTKGARTGAVVAPRVANTIPTLSIRYVRLSRAGAARSPVLATLALRASLHSALADIVKVTGVARALPTVSLRYIRSSRVLPAQSRVCTTCTLRMITRRFTGVVLSARVGAAVTMTLRKAGRFTATAPARTPVIAVCVVHQIRYNRARPIVVPCSVLLQYRAVHTGGAAMRHASLTAVKPQLSTVLVYARRSANRASMTVPSYATAATLVTPFATATKAVVVINP